MLSGSFFIFSITVLHANVGCNANGINDAASLLQTKATVVATDEATCGEKIADGQCHFEATPNGVKEGLAFPQGYDHAPNYGSYSVRGTSAEDCAAKLAPTAGSDACPNANIFIYHTAGMCACMLRPSRTDCDTYKTGNGWSTYSFGGCNVPAPVPAPPAPKGACGDKIADGQCRHQPDNVYAHMPVGGGNLCSDGGCDVQECATRAAALAGTDFCPNTNIFIHHSNGACLCQWKLEECDEYPITGYSTYNLAGCLATDTATTTTTTTTAPDGTITILDAKYGYNNCGDQGSDETSNLGKACNGKTSCSYKVDSAVIGDPAASCQKQYHYTFTCGSMDSELLGQRTIGQVHDNPVIEASGKTLVIECPTKTAAEILSQDIVFGDMGSNECPAGSEEFTEAECTALGEVDFSSSGRTNNVNWDNPGYTGTGNFAGANTWNNIPNGCTTIPDSPKHDPHSYYFNRAQQTTDYNNPVGYQFKLCKGAPTTTQAADPYNCFTKELWTEEKSEWCCENNGLGCQATPTPTPVPTSAPTPAKVCRSSCHRGVYIKKKSCQRDKCAGCCECTGECEPIKKPPRPKKCLDKCYRKTKGNREVRNKNDMKKHMCHKNKCGACPECQPAPTPSDTCDGSCYTAKGALDPSKQCGKQKCAGCTECALFLSTEETENLVDEDDLDDEDDNEDDLDDDDVIDDNEEAAIEDDLKELVKAEKHLYKELKIQGKALQKIEDRLEHKNDEA